MTKQERRRLKARTDTVTVLGLALFLAFLYLTPSYAVTDGERERFHRALSASDTVGVMYEGIPIIHSFLDARQADSAGYYLNLVLPYEKGISDDRVVASINVIKGTLAVTTELDYSKAIDCFLIALDHIDENRTDDIIAVNANIVNLFFILSDKGGSEYAIKAYSLARNSESSQYSQCIASAAMAEMSYLSGDSDSAFHYASESDSIARCISYPLMLPVTNLIKADILHGKGRSSEAKAYYTYALEHSDREDPGIIALIYLHYGKYLEDMDMRQEAIDLYLKGLDISCRHGNLEFRDRLFSRLSDLYYHLGDKEKSLEYYRQYHEWTDSVALFQKEQAFDDFMVSLRKVEHEKQIYAKELELSEANRKTMTITFVLVIVVILSSFLFIIYRRNRKMYRALVLQYRNYSQRMDTKDEVSEAKEEQSSAHDLYLKLEHLMKVDKIFTQKDLSLDKLAEAAGSNRSYVSKAINNVSGMSFYDYVNMHRIREAARIISSGDDVTFKALADRLGYNSESIFYKAFSKEIGCTPGQYRKESRRLDRNNTENR